MSDDNKTKIGCSTGFLPTLALIFIVLKLCGVIAWSWWWVLAPLWIPIILAVLIWCIIILIAIWNDGLR